MFRAQHLMRRVLSPSAFAILLTFGAFEARAVPVYTIRDLGTLPGTSNSVATSINNEGQVVGISYNDTDGTFYQNIGRSTIPPAFLPGDGGGAKSFLYDGGQTSQVDPIGGLATPINDHGQIVGGQYSSINNVGQYVGGNSSGIMYDGSEAGPPVLVDQGSTTPLPSSFVPYGINDSGRIVGGVQDYDRHGFHPVVYQDGKMTDYMDIMPSSGIYGSDGRMVAVAQNGAMLISYGQPNQPTTSWLLSPEKGFLNLSALPLGNGSGMIGAALNDSGHVVGNGYYYDGDTVVKLTDMLGSPGGWSSLNATAINDSDWIVGQGTIDGRLHAFLMTPADAQVPEPAALLVWGALAAVAARRLTGRG